MEPLLANAKNREVRRDKDARTKVAKATLGMKGDEVMRLNYSERE